LSTPPPCGTPPATGRSRKIEPPVELPRPISPVFDEEIASGVLGLLTRECPTTRVLQHALDWFRIALSNAEVVPLPVRIEAGRTALEIMTRAGEETKRLVRAYGRFVRDDTTTTARYEDVFWAKGPVELTSDEWWMTRLCQLRNAIVHGDDVSEELWEHEGSHQLNHVHDRLISVLHIFVAEKTGDAPLRLAQVDRLFARAAQQARDFLRQARQSDRGSVGDQQDD
jgi:hypothetical protein